MSTVVLAVGLGFAAGVLAGLFGVGGGILFVPTLVLVLEQSQLEAQATSLAAMVPVVLVGVWRQQRAGNVRWRPAVLIGACSLAGVGAGVAVAESLPENVLRTLFAAIVLIFAAGLLRAALKEKGGL